MTCITNIFSQLVVFHFINGIFRHTDICNLCGLETPSFFIDCRLYVLLEEGFLYPEDCKRLSYIFF